MLNVLELPSAATSSTPLRLDQAGLLDLAVQDFIGQRVAWLGSSGTGKTNSLALILEKLLPFMPFVIFDQHNEFWGLCERYELLRVGQSADAQIKAGAAQAAQIADLSHSKRLSVLVEMLEMTEEERLEFVHLYCARIWELNKIPKQPYGVVLEEAQNFIPESKALTPALKRLKQFALEGRKFGFSIFLSSQRTAEVNKTILGQCRVAFLHGVDIYNDVQAYAGMLPFTLAETKKIALSLGTGECIVKVKRTGPAQYHHPVKMLPRETFHVGDTPTLDQDAPPPLRTIDAALLAELRKMLTAPADKKPDKSGDISADKIEADNAQIADLKTKLAAAQAEIERLKGQIAAAAQVKPADKKPDISMVKTADVQLNQTSQPAAWDGRSPLATARAKAKQQRDFEGLLRTIRDQKAIHRRILVYLTWREGQAFSERDLARFLGYSLSSIQHGGYPNDLVKRKLIHRGLTANRREYTFLSTVREHLAELCPDLDIEPLVERICKLEKV